VRDRPKVVATALVEATLARSTFDAMVAGVDTRAALANEHANATATAVHATLASR
jgi:hypothetical protein